MKTEGASTRIKPIKPIDLLPQEKNKFFRYRGSFTTPTIDVPDVYENLQTLGPSMCFNHKCFEHSNLENLLFFPSHSRVFWQKADFRT